MNSVAIEYLNLKTFRALQTSRDKLKEAGLIDFKTLNGSKVVTYSLYDYEKQTFAPIAKVLSKVSAKVATQVDAKVSAEVDDSVLLSNKQKLKLKRERENNTTQNELILGVGEISERLKFQEYQVKEFLMRSHNLTEIQYEWAVDYFIGDKTAGENELDKPYTEVIGHFKSWVKYNKKMISEHGKEQKSVGRNTGHNIGGINEAADRILREAAGKNSG
jgi:hypothetical protein